MLKLYQLECVYVHIRSTLYGAFLQTKRRQIVWRLEKDRVEKIEKKEKNGKSSTKQRASVIKQSIICTFNQLLPALTYYLYVLQFTVIVLRVGRVVRSLLLFAGKASHFVYIIFAIALQLAVAIIVIIASHFAFTCEYVLGLQLKAHTHTHTHTNKSNE